jgi:lysophospholipase L1-like esterase
VTVDDNMQWTGSWTTTVSQMDGITLDGQTIRMIAHTSIGGHTLRVRLSNAYGLGNLKIGGAGIAIRDERANIIPATNRVLTFIGSPATSIAPGGRAVSDPIEFDAPPLSDLAISVFLPGRMDDDFPITGHGNSRQTSYISDAGDFTAAAELPVAEETQAYLFLAGIDVVAPASTGGIVAIGDSLTDCNISTIDANYRWTNQLARRLVERHGERAPSVMNQGIGGNRIVHDARGGSAQRRFDRDVLAQPGASHVIVFLGINDIRNRGRMPEEEVTATELETGLHQLAQRARSRSLKIYGGTMLTFENEDFNPPPGMPGLYTPEGEAIRQEVNGWIRAGGAFDAVIDFEAELADPAHPTRMLPDYDCGDHLHPSDAGYLRMGDIIDLTLFD